MDSSSRRRFLVGSGLWAAAALTACQKSAAPAFHSTSQRGVLQVLPGVPTTDGAGVSLTRVIGQQALRHLDPFLLLDRFHSDDPSAYIRGFPDHPHRGFETVTVMLEGRMRHRDSRGNQGLIQGGGAQWMTAGRGLIHSEMPEQEAGLMSGFQLWVNLPAREKMRAPLYRDLPPAELAEASVGTSGSRVRVVAGNMNGLVGPVRDVVTSPTLVTATLEDDAPFELETPEAHTAFAFVSSGEVRLGPENGATRVGEDMLAVLGPGRRLRVRAPSRRSTLLIAAARPLHEPIVQHGPFVMNTPEEIRRAWADYRAGVLDQG
ncbi:pirin family protein [Myxococcaceae bacterium GXIMD 01537]